MKMRNKIELMTTLCLSFFTWPIWSVANFNHAKIGAYQIFQAHPVTLYCQCRYYGKKIDLKSCGMQSAASIPRANRLEWEHMMPAENFGQHFKCWRENLCAHKGKMFKGRKCCSKIDPNFKQAEGELYNLWPAVGLINQVRSNWRYSMLPAMPPFYGCNFKVDKQLRRVEPADAAKGIVARANLFMAEHYHIHLSTPQEQLFKAWDKQFPPSEWEKQWANKVAALQGYRNHFIDDHANAQAQPGNSLVKY